jgi:hypothetical protein
MTIKSVKHGEAGVTSKESREMEKAFWRHARLMKVRWDILKTFLSSERVWEAWFLREIFL